MQVSVGPEISGIRKYSEGRPPDKARHVQPPARSVPIGFVFPSRGRPGVHPCTLPERQNWVRFAESQVIEVPLPAVQIRGSIAGRLDSSSSSSRTISYTVP